MRRAFVACVTVIATLLIAGAAVAETKVTVSGTHLCCGACLKAVDTTLKDMSGVKFKSDQGSKTIVITADSDEAAQKAVSELKTQNSVDVALPYLTADANGPKHLEARLTREMIEELVK